MAEKKEEQAPDPALSRETLMSLAEQRAVELGITFTRVRRRVYELLLDANGPIGAYEVAERLKGTANTQPPTAYRALNCLEALGLIHKIQSISRYVVLLNGPRDTPPAFVICRECGSAEQIPLHVDSRTLLASAQAKGYHQLDLNIELTGWCREHGASPSG